MINQKNGSKKTPLTVEGDPYGEINDRAMGLIRFFRTEFGGRVATGKLTLKLIRCGKKGCRSCPHGPYWYRAVFNPRTGRWMFKYFRSSLSRGMLKSERERRLWERYRFYDREAQMIRAEKLRLSRLLKMNKGSKMREPCGEQKWQKKG